MSVRTQLDPVWEGLDRHVPVVDTGLTDEQEAVFLAGSLLVGMAVFVPVFAATVGALDLPVPLPQLVGVALVSMAYATLVLVVRRVVAGSFVALVVLGTFKANVPVIDAANRFPKDVVGDLLVVHVPIACLAIAVVGLGWYHYAGTPGVLLSAFVLSTTVPWVLGWAPSVVAAAWFTLFVGVALVTYLVAVGAVTEEYIAFRTVVLTLVLTASAHAAVAVVQFLVQDPLGFTRLGEGGAGRRATVWLPAVGKATIGPFVSGFTGMSFVLAYLVVLVLPATVLFVARRRGEHRVLGVLWILGLVAVVRASASDAARGALVVALLSFGLLLTIGYRRTVVQLLRTVGTAHSPTLRRGGLLAWVVLPAVVILGYPSTASGSAVGGGTADGRATAVGRVAREVGVPGIDLQSLSIPLVNLSNLGVRLQQYAAAIDVFLSHPGFGIGGANWVVVAGEYGFVPPPNASFPPPIHSVYFTLLAETGAVGLVLYLASLAAVVRVGYRLISYNGFGDWRYVYRPGTDRAMVAAVLAGLVGTFSFSVFGVLGLYAAAGLLPVWVLAGTLVGEHRRLDAAETPPV